MNPDKTCSLCEHDCKSPGREFCRQCLAMLAERRRVKDCPWTNAAAHFFGRDWASPIIGLALERAADEGRLHPDIAQRLGVPTGKHACPICGMLFWTDDEATVCCANARHQSYEEQAHLGNLMEAQR